ncbi:MAG: tetratricopeptide repeat protein [Chloroflexi bacterium]|nr:tetratricopeptide repeat protein [Chloroflexota bacterium]
MIASPPQFEYDVFLSHNRADKNWTRMLAARIEREKWNERALKVFFDEWDIQPGDNIPIALERALPTSRKIALVMSPDFFNSEWTESERAAATIFSPANRSKRMMPLLVRDCDIPSMLAPLKYIDFRDAAKFESAFKQLLAFLREEPLPRGDAGQPQGLPLQNIAPIPRAPQYGFVARYDDQGNNLVERVSDLLKQNRAVAMIGSGGVGKTTIAAEIARRVPSSPTRRGAGGEVVWASADGRADFSLTTLLDDAATQLGNADLRTLALEQKKDAVRNLLADPSTSSGRAMIVLDNFETIADEQQKAIAAFVSTLSSVPVLITSRSAIEGADRVTVGAMSLEEARDFLKRANVQASAIDAVADLAERNPAVMRWIIGQLNSAQRLSDIQNDLSRGEGDAATRLFGRSFGLLNADAQAALLSLALFAPSAERNALAFTAEFGDDIKRVNDALKQLAGLQLLETDAANERLSVVGLTRRFTRAQLEKDSNAAAYRKRFVDYFVRYAQAHAETTPEDFDALEAERENLFAAMDAAFAAQDWESVMRTMDAIFEGLLYTHGYWDDAIARGEQAAEAARRAGDESANARFSGNAATIHYSRGEYENARSEYGTVLEAYKNLKNEANVAVALHQLGIIAQDQGDYETARQRYAESLEIKKKLGDQSGIARTLHQLGRLAEIAGDYETARQRYTESLEIAKKLGAQSGIAKTLNALGNIATTEGKFEQAKDLLAGSLEIARRLGDQLQIGSASWGLAGLAEKQGNKTEAARLFRDVLEIFERLKSPDAEKARRSLERVTKAESSKQKAESKKK